MTTALNRALMETRFKTRRGVDHDGEASVGSGHQPGGRRYHPLRRLDRADTRMYMVKSNGPWRRAGTGLASKAGWAASAGWRATAKGRKDCFASEIHFGYTALPMSDALKFAFEILVVGALALPWLTVLNRMFPTRPGSGLHFDLSAVPKPAQTAAVRSGRVGVWISSWIGCFAHLPGHLQR